MNTMPTSSGTSPGARGAGTPRTLERDIHVAATIVIGFLLTALAWKIAWDLTAHLAVTYGGKGRLLAIRTPLFLISVILIWAGAASYGAKVVGKSFSNVVFDKRNLIMAQWVLTACAAWSALSTTIGRHLPQEVGKEVTEYNLAIALAIGAVILYALQRNYAPHATGSSGGTVRGTGEHHAGGGKLILYGLLILAAVDLGFWGLRWFNSKVIPTQQPPALQAAVQAPPPAPAPTKTWHGLTGGVEKTLTVTGDFGEEITVTPGHRVSLDDQYPLTWLVNKTSTIDGPFGGTKTNISKISSVRFKSKDGSSFTVKMATGLEQ